MLIDCEYFQSSKLLLVSYLDKNCEIQFKRIKWEHPYKYELCDEDDKDKEPVFRSFNGHAIKKVRCKIPDRYSIYNHLDDIIPPEEQEELYGFEKIKPYFIDIETFVGEDGFPEPADVLDEDSKVIKEGASTPVLVISVVYDNKIVIMGHRDLEEEKIKRIGNNINDYFKQTNNPYKFKYIQYNDEFDMLYQFFYDMVPNMPILTGWNFLEYDWTYLVNRARKLTKTINGIEHVINPAVCSITRHLHKVRNKNYELPAHRIVMDYMKLYKTFDETIKVKESSSLNFVSQNIIGNEKIKYEGRIQDMYDNDFEKYVYYNAVDSVLVQKIHEKQNYMNIGFAITREARMVVRDLLSHEADKLGSLAVTEGVLRPEFRKVNRLLFKDYTKESESRNVVGGWVKDACAGLRKAVAITDYASLYPTTMRQFKMSPENYLGTIRDKISKVCDNGYIVKENDIVTVSGAVFKNEDSPSICMLNNVYGKRKQNKKEYLKYEMMYNDCKHKIKKLEKLLNE